MAEKTQIYVGYKKIEALQVSTLPSSVSKYYWYDNQRPKNEGCKWHKIILNLTTKEIFMKFATTGIFYMFNGIKPGINPVLKIPKFISY